MWNNEPVRVAIYPILLLIIGFGAARGWVDNETAVFVGSLAALILGAFGVEVARKNVTPYPQPDFPSVETPSVPDLDSVTGDDPEPLGKELS
jgi:hypothetical protein